MQKILPLLVFFLLIFEGLGVNFGREATLILIILLFPILFTHMLFHKRKVVLPKVTSIPFLIFIASALISTVISVGVTQSIQYLFVLISLFLAFLISYNYKNEIEKPITILIFASSFLFTIYSLLFAIHLNLFVPQNGYQFVFSRFSSHNHLGDFLVLPTILCIYYLFHKSNKPSYDPKSSIINHAFHMILATCYIILATYFIFFSYSRSAYLTLAVTITFILLAYLQKKHSWPTKWVMRIIIFVVLLTTGFFLIATTNQAQKQPITSVTNKTLVQDGGLKYKDLSGGRPEYIRQSLLSAQKNPIFGIGPNNFAYASKLYSNDPTRSTQSAHNIFLEILVGQGLLGLLSFAGLILIILIKSRKNALFYLFLAMLINFQTDYTYQIYSFLLLFFALAGIVSNEKPSSISLPA